MGEGGGGEELLEMQQGSSGEGGREGGREGAEWVVRVGGWEGEAEWGRERWSGGGKGFEEG